MRPRNFGSLAPCAGARDLSIFFTAPMEDFEESEARSSRGLHEG